MTDDDREWDRCGPRRRKGQRAPTVPTLQPLGQRIRRLRYARGLRQKDLAARARVSTFHVQRIEYADANPTILTLYDIARVLGVSVVDLLLDDEPDA